MKLVLDLLNIHNSNDKMIFLNEIYDDLCDNTSVKELEESISEYCVETNAENSCENKIKFMQMSIFVGNLLGYKFSEELNAAKQEAYRKLKKARKEINMKFIKREK